MMPLDKDYYAIQRSIVECSYMGCSTIWIICEESVAPILKKVCGDFVTNLAENDRAMYANFPEEHRKYIPIMYAPISYKMMNKKGLGVPIVDGVHSSYSVSAKLSKWVVPYRYYVSMPYGVYKPRHTKLRALVREYESVFLTHDGESARTGAHIGFSFSPRQFVHCSYLFKRMDVKSDYTIDKVFGDDIMIENSTTYDLEYYHDISTWGGYTEMISNPIRVTSDWRFCFNKSFKKDERKLD